MYFKLYNKKWIFIKNEKKIVIIVVSVWRFQAKEFFRPSKFWYKGYGFWGFRLICQHAHQGGKEAVYAQTRSKYL